MNNHHLAVVYISVIPTDQIRQVVCELISLSPEQTNIPLSPSANFTLPE